MTNTQTQKDNWKHLDTVIAASTGAGMSEIGRQMVLFDQVPWWRVLLLIVCALVCGGVVTTSFYKSPWRSSSTTSRSSSQEQVS